MSSLIRQISHAVSAYYPIGHIAIYIFGFSVIAIFIMITVYNFQHHGNYFEAWSVLALAFIIPLSCLLALCFDSKSIDQREPFVPVNNGEREVLMASPKPWENNYRNNIISVTKMHSINHQESNLQHHHYHNVTGQQILNQNHRLSVQKHRARYLLRKHHLPHPKPLSSNNLVIVIFFMIIASVCIGIGIILVFALFVDA